jgi:thiol-disulfide isomerase/thioredoxin
VTPPRLLLAALVCLGLASCSTRGNPAAGQSGLSSTEGRVHAVLINGGGRREINFQSHLHHLERLIGLLQASGLGPEDITVFNADGADPAEDLATRELPASPDFWLLPVSGGMRMLAPPMVYVDSEVDGFEVHPARKRDLEAWFAGAGRKLRAGDTLLLYVTDHGERNDDDLTNNTIVLWGPDPGEIAPRDPESTEASVDGVAAAAAPDLSVSELRDLLGEIDPGVRVVMLMSQCFSGSFSHVLAVAGEEPSGDVCGYFSSTADRLAYGCYPENRGKDGVGHSFHFFEALEPLGAFPEAHRRVLIADDTPDVPHTTGDFYLERLLEAEALAQGRTYVEVVDELLDFAWRDRGAREADIRLLDGIGHRFGSFSPRSLGELDEHALVLPEFSRRLGTYATRWSEALEALRIETLDRFVTAHPEWRDRLKVKDVRALSPRDRQVLAGEMLAAYAPFARADPALVERMESLRQRAEEAAAATYRAEVRAGVVLRMRAILTQVAGETYLETRGTPEQRQTYARLRDCENLQFAALTTLSDASELDPPEAFPPLAEERELLERVMPAWMGVQYRPVPEIPRRRLGTGKGAALVSTVFPESPAEKAGMRVGDIVLGAAGERFVEPHQMREWTMRSEVGRPEKLDLLRDGKPIQVTLRPGPYPLALPKLPGPPQVGGPAPKLRVEPYRGEIQLAASKPRLLFFWATWCAICHASVPEVLAFAEARGVEVVAITDEDPEVLNAFFADSQDPFPATIAVDPYRFTFQDYGVSGTPTFVLVDGEGVVRHYQSGYSLARGLTVDGWQWNGAARQVRTE